jgi:hypothetical protein
MPVPARTPLGASTLVRKWLLDVNTGTVAAPVWTPVRGILDFNPNLDPTLQDDSDFDGGGYKSQTVTALAWSAAFTVSRKAKADAPTVYDEGQEFIRLASLTMGIQNSIGVRFYEVTSGGPTTEAYQGLAAVSWSPKGGAMDALDESSVTLTGQGARTSITNPASVPVGIPVITSVSPVSTGVAGGALITVNGNGFTGATVLKVGATVVVTTAYVVQSDTRIVFTAPAKTAAAYEVEVTTPAGVSAHVPANDTLTYV